MALISDTLNDWALKILTLAVRGVDAEGGKDEEHHHHGES